MRGLILIEPFALGDDVRCPALDLAQHLGNASFRIGEAVPAFLAGRQSVRDLFLPILDGAHERRPDEFRAEQNEREERDGLHQQGKVDVHDDVLFSSLQAYRDQRITKSKQHRDTQPDDE